MTRNWLNDLALELRPVQLSRELFAAQYFPQYAKPWQPDYRIRLRKGGRPVRMPTAADAKAQQTKRDRRIDAEYARYCACFGAMVNWQQAKGE